MISWRSSFASFVRCFIRNTRQQEELDQWNAYRIFEWRWMALTYSIMRGLRMCVFVGSSMRREHERDSFWYRGRYKDSPGLIASRRSTDSSDDQEVSLCQLLNCCSTSNGASLPGRNTGENFHAKHAEVSPSSVQTSMPDWLHVNSLEILITDRQIVWI